MRGGHQDVDSEAFSLITPPKAGSGGGSCFPLSVVAAPDEPGVLVVCCAGVRFAATVASENAVSAIRRVPAVYRLRKTPLLLNETYRLSIAGSSFRLPNAFGSVLAIA